MSKKKVCLQAASVLMSAAMVGSMLPAGALAESEDTVPAGTEATTTGLAIVYNGMTIPTLLEGSASLGTFFEQMLAVAGLQGPEHIADLRIDQISEDGLRTRMRVGDATADAAMSVQTVTDLCDLAKKQGTLHLVLFMDSGSGELEIARWDLTTADGMIQITSVRGGQEYSQQVRFDANGGTLGDKTYQMRGANEKLSYIEPTATREGYTFLGWADAESNPVTEDTVVPVGGLRVYAQWEALTPETPENPDGAPEQPDGGGEDDPGTQIPDDEKNPDDGNDNPGGDTGDPGQKPGGGGEENPGGSTGGDGTDTPSDDTEDGVISYQLTVHRTDGQSLQVSVRPYVTLDALMDRLGYSADQFLLDGTTRVEGEVTMEELLGQISGTSVLKAYDENGLPAGEAKIAKTAEGAYDVTITAADDQTPDEEQKPGGSDDGSDKTDPDDEENPDDPSMGIPGGPSGSEDPTDPQRPGTSTEDPNGNGDDADVVRYTLTVLTEDGRKLSVSVNDDVQLQVLAQRLGYTVDHYAIRTQAMTDTAVDPLITMKDLMAMADDGDALLLAYDASNNAIGSARITKMGEASYLVTISGETNVDLNMPADTSAVTDNKTGTDDGTLDGKGKGEGVPEDTVSPSAPRTGDANTIPVYGGLAGVSAALLGVLAALRRKLTQ